MVSNTTNGTSEALVRIGVVGLGRMGKRHVHTLLTRLARRVTVVAVCSELQHEVEWANNNTEYQKLGIKAYNKFEDFLEHPGMNAIWVSTSTDVHARQALGGINKGMHVLCEKPLSVHVKECEEVCEAAKAHPELKVMAGFSRRFDDSYRDAATKILKGQAIGKPFMVRSQTCDLLDETGFFVRYSKRNGGIFVDCSIHDIDLTLWYLQDPVPKSCWAVGTLQHHPELAESNDVDNGVGVVEFWGGKIAYFYCSRTQAHGHDVSTEVIGTEGKIDVNLVPAMNKVKICDRQGIRHEVDTEYWDRFEHAFALEANEFVDSILEDKPVPLPLELGLKVMVIGNALQDSLIRGEVVRFNEQGVRIN
ncbi:hypothetical protein B9Z65_4964 [Elsinoe australis]|uniref:Uncharacterized protein n=1 Tax=Elsinoe australis TaxID=40998 RepID=A0A2P7ZCP6_9PEZI|nr:hypothetical protein B9Z65_4964 [Elsinoe australis]